MLMFILRKTAFGKNNSIATVISLAISFMAMYGLNRTNFDLTIQFYKLGIPEDSLYIAMPILTIIFLFFLSRKTNPETETKRFSFGRFLTILGGLMLLLGLMPFIYQKAFMIGLGAGLVVVGMIISKKQGKRILTTTGRGIGQVGRYAGKELAATGKGIGQATGYTKDQIKQMRHEVKKRKRAARIAQIRQAKIEKENLEKLQNRENEMQRKRVAQEQEEIARKMRQQQKSQLALPYAKQQLALPPHEQKKYIKNERLRERSIQNLKSLYNQKYQEAIKQANFTAKGVPGAKEKYIRLQKEMERIVNKLNKI